MALPLTLYVHLPWCVRRCPYCDFNAHALDGDLPEDTYIDALLDDLDDEAADVTGREVHAIFLGGGTPSLFSAESIARILERASERLTLSGDCEITLEANPGTAEYAKFAGFRAAGVNRLSLGVQSFDDAMLKALGRIHDAGEAERAIDAARRAGFDRLNIDLMHGLPGQSPDGARADIERALAFEPGHLSWYQLTLEPNTPFGHSPPELPDEDTLATIQDAGQALLTTAGYRQYEVSAWSRPGEECRHNLNYWRFGDYLGVGAGAHGKITVPGQPPFRRWKKRHPKAWLAPGDRIDGQTELDPPTVRFEFMLNALRLPEGFTEYEFHGRTGRDLSEIGQILDDVRTRGLIESADGRWRPTPLGWRFLNDLQAAFLP